MNLRTDNSVLLRRADAEQQPQSNGTPERADQPVMQRRPVLPLLLFASVVFWIVAWHWDTAFSMASIWWRSETFAHGMVVYPISMWLVWRKRHVLRNIDVTPSFWVLLPLAGTGFGWLLGELGGVQAARHLCLVSMIALSIWALLGTRAARVIAFPLAYTLLAVPIGEFLLPVLMELTADFTVAALRMTGIPVYREGLNFVLPTGSWSVVEACSGLRYLIASITLGLLYAYLTYNSILRRMLFAAASLLVPLVANWVRAYMIVMIGHLTGMKYAVGIDHLLYGWLFFGLVMLVLFWIGTKWRQDPTPNSDLSHGLTSFSPGLGARQVAGALLTAVVAIAGPVYAEFLERRLPHDSAAAIVPSVTNGWQVSVPGLTLYRPHYFGARATFDATYEKNGNQVGVFVGYYARQQEGAEMISTMHSVVPDLSRYWIKTEEQRISDRSLGLDLVQTRLRSKAAELTVWHWYWAGGRWVSEPAQVKLIQAFEKLIGRDAAAAVVVLYVQSDRSARASDSVLREFSRDMVPSLDAALREIRAESAESHANAVLAGH